jgi:hypothetical protein
MRINMKGLVGLVAGLLLATITSPVALGQAQHVRWDIINIAFGTPPTLTPGGVADAFARFPPPGGPAMRIRLSGSGTFVAPQSGGTSNAVRGGGTWETFGSDGVSTGSGTYWVVGLAFWQFTSPFAAGPIDLIGPNGANGNAFLRIQYSDGSNGVLGIGCHGPGAPNGIVEGVIASKDDVTYWDAGAPVAGVNTNRTAFHLE